MKKKITLALFCLCMLNMYGQEYQISNGTYTFEKAELIVERYDTKEEIERETVTDPNSIDANNIHWKNTILEIDIVNGVIEAYTMSDQHRYCFDENMRLQPYDLKQEELQNLMAEETTGYEYLGNELSPYQIKTDGEKIIIAFEKYNFGQSGINFTMVAALNITMTKQKDR